MSVLLCLGNCTQIIKRCSSDVAFASYMCGRTQIIGISCDITHLRVTILCPFVKVVFCWSCHLTDLIIYIKNVPGIFH